MERSRLKKRAVDEADRQVFAQGVVKARHGSILTSHLCSSYLGGCNLVLEGPHGLHHLVKSISRYDDRDLVNQRWTLLIDSSDVAQSVPFLQGKPQGEPPLTTPWVPY